MYNVQRNYKIIDLFKVKLYTSWSETEKKEKEIDIAWLTEQSNIKIFFIIFDLYLSEIKRDRLRDS